MSSGVPCKPWRNRFSPNSTHRGPHQAGAKSELAPGAAPWPASTARGSYSTSRFSLLPPPVPGLSLGKAPAEVFPTRRTLGLGVLDQRWWVYNFSRPAGEGTREADPGRRGGGHWPGSGSCGGPARVPVPGRPPAAWPDAPGAPDAPVVAQAQGGEGLTIRSHRPRCLCASGTRRSWAAPRRSC